MKNKIKKTLTDYHIAFPDIDFLAEQIASAITARNGDDNNLVIVANKGIHPIDESKLPAGDLFYASEGNIGGDPMSAESLKSDLEAITAKCASKVKSKPYRKIYIVPSGFPIISQFITSACFQITALPPVILQYDRATGEYWPFELKVRQIVANAS
ncbi:MAG: hypothetical protein C4589_00310 [Peptococcaceae bacterium]|jgi:hypothetical protein|nr:MAG: hypothetical protein C4589_00310 [Peptococcaceae bacterium]